MLIKEIVKWCIPHGIYNMYLNLKRHNYLFRITTHRGILEFTDYDKNLTNTIGDDWKESSYYEFAENNLNTWWDENSIFHKYFIQLDCKNIVELACGHGRHVQKYIEMAEMVTLVDINQENIDFCKKRYINETKIKYLVNDGSNFKGIDSNSQTAIFTYDAMVHFEMLDIIEYLKDANRILVDGGKILFHHSNAAFSPELFYTHKPHGRNYLSADIFAYMALRCGFKILSQDIMSWGEGSNLTENIDCLSFCQKVKNIY